jgi:hypothetical protein
MGILPSTYQRSNIIAVPFLTKDKHMQQLEWTLLAMKYSTIACDVLGVEGSPTTTKSHTDLDTGRIRKSVWDKTTDRKRRLAEANTEKCLEGRQLTKRDNIWNFAYRRGMAGPQVDGHEDEDSNPTRKKQAANLVFAYYDKKGHKMTKSNLCLFTLALISPFYRPDNIEMSTGKSPIHFVPWFSSKYGRMNALQSVQKDALLSLFQGIEEEASVSSEPDWDSDLKGCSNDKNSILIVLDAQFEWRMVDTIDLQDDGIPNLPLP